MAHAQFTASPEAVRVILNAHDKAGNVYHFIVSTAAMRLDLVVDGDKGGGLSIELNMDGTWKPIIGLDV